MKNTILTAVLTALIVGLPISCATCPVGEDHVQCDVQNAEAVASLVDHAAGTAIAVLGAFIPPVVTAAYAVFHTALPLAITALDSALAEYESAHSGAWSVVLAGLVSLYENFDNLWTSVTGRPSLVNSAKAQVKARGAAQVLSMLKTEQGKDELLKSMKVTQ